ncbi:MAG: methylmalonyl-CoA mutase, partial [Oscillochloris sp.]|nr:methylmalonyl-CoA mutase [Oscillochloris sp.]
AYKADTRIEIPILAMDPEGERKHLARLNRVRTERDDNLAQLRLAELRGAALGSVNTMPAILNCVRAYCTVGEMCDVFRTVFGVYQETVVV